MNGHYFSTVAIKQTHVRGKFYVIRTFPQGGIGHFPAPDVDLGTKKNKT